MRLSVLVPCIAIFGALASALPLDGTPSKELLPRQALSASLVEDNMLPKLLSMLDSAAKKEFNSLTLEQAIQKLDETAMGYNYVDPAVLAKVFEGAQQGDNEAIEAMWYRVGRHQKTFYATEEQSKSPQTRMVMEILEWYMDNGNFKPEPVSKAKFKSMAAAAGKASAKKAQAKPGTDAWNAKVPKIPLTKDVVNLWEPKKAPSITPDYVPGLAEDPRKARLNALVEKYGTTGGSGGS